MVYFSVLRMAEINSSVNLVLATHFYDVVLQEMTIVLHCIGPKFRLLLMGVTISNIINGYDCSNSSSSSSSSSNIHLRATKAQWGSTGVALLLL